MSAGTRLETKSLDRILAIACALSGIGFLVTNKQLTSNVATLTTATPHGFNVGDKVTVKGVDATFDGIELVLTAAAGSTLSYAKVAANVGSTIVSATPVAGVSKLVSCGHKRWADDENFDAIIRNLSAETQGHFWAAFKTSRGQGEMEIKTLGIAAELAVAVPKDSSSDLNSAWELALRLQDALQASGNYGTRELWPVISVGLNGVDDSEGMGLAIFDFGLGDAGGSMEIIDP